MLRNLCAMRSDLTTAFAEALQSIATKELASDAIRAARQRILDMLSVTFDGLDDPASENAFCSVVRVRVRVASSAAVQPLLRQTRHL